MAKNKSVAQGTGAFGWSLNKRRFLSVKKEFTHPNQGSGARVPVGTQIRLSSFGESIYHNDTVGLPIAVMYDSQITRLIEDGSVIETDAHGTPLAQAVPTAGTDTSVATAAA
jgi:hypothetical protein